MKGAKVSIETHEGIVELTGTVVSPDQHDQIVKTLQRVPGVKRIDSGITLGNAEQTEGARSPAPGGFERTAGEQGPAAPAARYRPRPWRPMTSEPAPLNGMPAMAALDPSGPRLPPYAWPTYAPYNNFSRVAYPQSYPYNAFPFIGPYYPFPKVPLGWRKVDPRMGRRPLVLRPAVQPA